MSEHADAEAAEQEGEARRMGDHEVRSLADVCLLEVVYNHFPEPFLHRYNVRVRIVAVDKVSSAMAMNAFLQHQANRFRRASQANVLSNPLPRSKGVARKSQPWWRMQ